MNWSRNKLKRVRLMKKKVKYSGTLKKGMRVIAYESNGREEFRGSVYTVSSGTACIKRDDKVTGAGTSCPGYGQTWRITKEDYGWNHGGYGGYLVLERISNWKERMKNVMKEMK